MNTRWVLLLLGKTAAFCFLLIGAVAQSTPEADKILASKVDKALPAFYNPESFGCVVLAARNGKVIYEKAVGLANIELNTPLTTASLFRIGSITKQFTAVAILQLMEKGLLSLQDDITRFIPDYPENGYRITIENLLTHTSGIKNFTDMKELDSSFRKTDIKPKSLIDFFKNQPMDFAPGTQWSYCNSGYVLLGYIIEKVSGKSYEDYIKENIFLPLGMTDSYYDNPRKIIKNRTEGYSRNRDNSITNAEYMSIDFAYAAGALLMTAGDLLKWHEGLYSYKILKKESLDKAFEPFTLKNGKKQNYGFGWELNSLEGSPTIEHGGSINGYSAHEIYLPKEDIFVTVLSNGIPAPARGLANLVSCIIAGKDNVKEINIKEGRMDKYIGTYKENTDKPSYSRIYKDHGLLYMFNSDFSKSFQLHFTSDSSFFCYEVFPNYHIFNADSNGKINAFVLHFANGYSIKLNRID